MLMIDGSQQVLFYAQPPNSQLVVAVVQIVKKASKNLNRGPIYPKKPTDIDFCISGLHRINNLHNTKC